MTTAGSVGSDLAADELLHAERPASAAATIGSRPRCGNAPWQPLAEERHGEIVRRRQQRRPAWSRPSPTFSPGQPCSPKIACTFGPMPAVEHPGRRPAAPPRRRLLRPAARSASRTRAARRSIDLRIARHAHQRRPMCPSCPQACMRPACVLAYGRPGLLGDRQRIDVRPAARCTVWWCRRSTRSSPSARLPRRRRARCSSRSSSARIAAAVLNSSNISSGIRCRRWRKSTAIGRACSTSACVLINL